MATLTVCAGKAVVATACRTRRPARCPASMRLYHPPTLKSSSEASMAAKANHPTACCP